MSSDIPAGDGKTANLFHSVLDKGSLAFHCTIQCLGIMLDTPEIIDKIEDVCEKKLIQVKTTTNSGLHASYNRLFI